MSSVAIFGAGDLGGAIALALARRSAFRRIELIDDNVAVAEGKALDIQQSGPIERFDTSLSATADVLAAAGASVIIVADQFGRGEWEGEGGLALLQKLARAGTKAPLVFAGPGQTALMETAARELRIPADRLVGTAGAAVVGAARSLVGIEVGGSGADVQLTVTGRPPAFVIAWSAATIGGSLVTDRVPAHRLLALSRSLASLWPPGPHAIAAATARVAEGLAFGSRRLEQAVTLLDGEFGLRGMAALMPLDLGDGRVLRRHMPSLSPQEKTGSGLFSAV